MMSLLAALVYLFWLVCGIDFIRGVGFKIPRLKKTVSSSLDSPPKVSLVFAARNEGPRMTPALRSMLSQDYPPYEVIAVNDRSTDETLKVMQSFATDPKLKIVNIPSLPTGWLGKNHALQRGYEAASGDWLLFTDADVIFEPRSLESVMTYCQQQRLDHLALVPKIVMKNLLEMIFTVCFGIGFFIYFRPWEVSNPESKAHMGIGAFNLVRRQVYEKIGGHQSFALNVLDDMELGRRIKAAGFRAAVAFGQEFLSVRWVEGWQGILKSLEKNGFAGMEYRPGFLFVSTVLSLLLNVLPFILIFAAGGLVQQIAAATVAMIFLVFLAAQRFYPGTLLAFPFYPLGCMLVFALIWRSAFLVLREGGIRWRDTFYKLEDLKGKRNARA